MTEESRRRHTRFVPRAPEDFGHPDLNPYLRIHAEHGPPVVTETAAPGWRGRWCQAFDRDAPLHVEVGTGNGFFFSGMAARHPHWNWVGVEIRFKRVMLTTRKVEAAGCVPWSRVVRYDAHFLEDLFAPGEVAGFYVNHPDPWPKDRQAKHRLFGPAFLDTLVTLLAPGGELRVKTDHRVNVESLLAALPGRPLALLGRSDDVAGAGAPWPDDVETNYQKKFRLLGEPVYAMRLRREHDAA